MGLGDIIKTITHKKIASEVSPVTCGDFNANHDIVNLSGYILVEEKNLDAGTTTCTFSGLDGDVDEEYLLETNVNMVRTGAYTNLVLQFNNQATTYNSSSRESLNGTTSTINVAFLYIASTGNSLNGISKGRATLFVKSGTVRQILTTFISSRIGYVANVVGAGDWANTSDNITSITLLASDSGSFSGKIRLWKRIPVEV